MENPKNEDIKKTGEKTAEVLEETVEEVGKEKVEKAEGFRDQFEGNDKEIEESLNGNNSPEAEGIRSKEKDVMNKAGEKISGFKNEVENIGDKEKAEREKLLEEVFENSVGGIHTAFHDKGFANKSYGKIKDFKGSIDRCPLDYFGANVNGSFKIENGTFQKEGINEAVAISPISTEVYGEKEFTKGTFFKKKEKKQVEIGRRSMDFDEIKENGKKEKAYKFVYKTIDDDKKQAHQVPDGRYGQVMLVELLLPESIALKILEEIKNEPKFAREIVEKLVKEKMEQDKWDVRDSDKDEISLRPPYEKWLENKGKSKMYVQEPDANFSEGFSSKYVIDAEKGKSQEDVKPKPAEQKTEVKKKQPDKIDKEKAKKPEEREKAIDHQKQIDDINYWLIETEKCTDIAQLKLNLKVIEEELAIAKNANIDTSQIADLEERIEKIKEAIDFEKKEEKEKEKAGTVKPEPKLEDANNSEPAGTDETEKIIPEPEPKPEPVKPEKTAEEIENEKLAEEIEREMNEKKLDEETRERLEEWDSKDEEEKKEEIKITVEGGMDKKTNKEKAGIKEKLGNRLIEREKEKAEEIERAKERGEAVETEGGARLINQENVKKILESRNELVKLRDEIGKEAEGGIKERKRIAEEIKTSIDPNNPELAKLNIGEKMMAKEAVSGFLKTTKDILSLSEIDYLLEAREIDFGNLPQTHEKRKIEMEELQETINAIEEYKKFMEEFEGMEEERREEAREELGRFVRWLNWVKENKEDLFLVMVAIGVVAGIAVLVSSIGLSSMSVPAYLTAENAVKAAVGLAAVGAVGYTVKKKKVQAVLKTAGMAVGLPILSAAFIANSILDSKKIDGWMEWATGTKMMFGDGSKKEK